MVTLPLVELVWHLSHRLSRSPIVVELVSLDTGTVEPEALQGLLFKLQLAFLVSHENTHHVHRHCAESQSGVIGVWTEFLHDMTCGNMNSQAQELDADGYAAYLVLAHLLRGEMRLSALAELGRANMPGTDGDALLLTCFFLAVLAFFCEFWRGDIDMASYISSGILPRQSESNMNQGLRVAWSEMDLFRNRGSVPHIQELFRVAAESIGKPLRPADAQMSFLHGQMVLNTTSNYSEVRAARQNLADEISGPMQLTQH